MRNKITLQDYNCEWALKEKSQIARSTPGYMTLADVVSLYHRLGVDGIEVMHYYWEDRTPAELKAIMEDAGLWIASYVFLVDLALPATSRQASIDKAFSILDRAAEVGTSLVMIVPVDFKPALSAEDQRNWMIDGLRVCAERAQSLNLTLLAENIDYLPARPLMGSGTQCRDICVAVDSPAFRLIYDAGCPLSVEEDSLETLKLMAPYVAHVHLKSSRLLPAGEKSERYLDSVKGRRFVGATLERGLVNIPRVLAELGRMGYRGAITLEYQGEEDPREAVRQNVEYVRRIVYQ